MQSLQEVGRSVQFTLENMSPTVPVNCTDSDNPVARICIPVTIIIFAEEDRITRQDAELIVRGITNTAQLSNSQAE